MAQSEHIPAYTLSLLSAVELEDVMARLHDFLSSQFEVSGSAVLMWDCDLETFADREYFGQAKELKELVEHLSESYSPEDPLESSVTVLDEDDLTASARKLGDIYKFSIVHAGELCAIVLFFAKDELDKAALSQSLSALPLSTALYRAWEMKELQRENERLRSQYEEIEDKTSSMEEQTRKLIHDITARDAIRMKQLERERLVYWISNAVRSSVHIKEVLDTTVEKIGATFGVSRCILLRAEHTVDERVEAVDVFEYTKKDVPSVQALFFTEKGKIFTTIALTKETPEHLDESSLTSGIYDSEFLSTLSLRSGLIVPLVMRDRILGALFLQDVAFERDWSIDDISVIGSLADNLSVAIENAELHQERERQAVTDGLTGVNNRRSFSENLQKEFERAKRYDQPLSLVIVDLDYLKRINDQYGHVAGDDAIRSIGGVLKLSSRSTDFVARYGGEEFCILLPNTEIDMAEQLAERLRRLINEVVIEGYGNISASLGVSNYPLHAQSAEELFLRADEALYKAKQGGRNCVVTAPLKVSGINPKDKIPGALAAERSDGPESALDVH